MAENEEIIEYSPAEQKEIDRILNYLSQETLGHMPVNSISADEGIDKEAGYAQEEVNIQFDKGDLGVLPEDEEIGEEFEADLEEQIISDQEESAKVEQEQEHEEEEELELEELEQNMLEDEPEEYQDITGLIHEIKDKKIEERPSDEISDEITDELLSEDFSAVEEIDGKSGPHEEPVEEEFDADLLESIDLDEVKPARKASEEPDYDLTMLADEFEKQEKDLVADEEGKKAVPVTEIPDISNEQPGHEPLLDEDLLEGLESTVTEQVPAEKVKPLKDKATGSIVPEEQFNLDELEGMDVIDETPAKSADDKFPDIDLTDLDELKTESEEKKPVSKTDKKINKQDLSPDFNIDQETHEEKIAFDISPEMGISESVEKDIPASPEKEGEIDLSDSELKKLNKAIQIFHPNLSKIIKDIILNDRLPGSDIRDLVDMLLSSTSEEDVKLFLEEKLNKKIDISAKAAQPKRRVIAARSEYTAEGREKQKKRIKNAGIIAAVGVVLLVAGVLVYKNIYIPVMAKKNIDEGVRIIKRPGVPVLQKQKDYKKAEELFNHVNDNYIKDYLYGYHSYAKAYFQNKEYDYALEKLNKAYDIDASNIDTLNNLGFFFAKVPEAKFEQIKPQLRNYYYKTIKPVGPINKQIDVAIDFYRKALNLDPNNITALYGIGNAYTSQGEFLKARQFYENILAVDKDSTVGYSGLMNLFIERDALPEVLTIQSDLEYKKKLSQVPRALLAKLASYYLSKKRTDSKNIRIDYGIQSPDIKDFNDNPFPAVKKVLNALAEQDMDYPPLFLHFARLSKEEKNYNLVKRNLLTALEREPNYFAAHILLAEHYYQTKDPVEAYKSCKKALQSFLSPPEFTNEDFYYETEKIGTAYAIMGNIFYYADRFNARFGDDFEDDNIEEKSDELATLSIAQDKYEKAISENFKSGEIFYNLGRIYYKKGQYDKAVTTWLNLYEDFIAQPELLFALGNAFYHLRNLEASKGEYLKVISFYEGKAENIKAVYPSREEHSKIFLTLSSVYNNLGAVYQIQNNETKANISYWKAIDNANKIERENEFARVNLARAFKQHKEAAQPVLDENIAVNVESYTDF
ncbi:MAG: tetratricopeptide repeat protein [Spirochaetota bacterium]